MGFKKNQVLQEAKNLYTILQDTLYFNHESKNIDFYISSLTEYNPFNTTIEIEQWLHLLNSEQPFTVTRIPLADLERWQFNNWTGDLSHDSGGFFSIRGLRVNTNVGAVAEWTQPIIYQPEIGLLGIITKKINGILYFLMQAKAEPGNINTYQISPTVQATRSNYLGLHGGGSVRYIEYFFDKGKAAVLVDQLQSEQGARFYRKRNRNIIVRVPDDCEIDLDINHRWVTLAQLLHLLQKDNIVNMDTRSVLSEINFAPEKVNSHHLIDVQKLRYVLENSELVEKPVREFALKLMFSAHPNSPAAHSIDQLLMNITDEKFKCELDAQLIPLNEVMGWKRTPDEIFHEEEKYFSIIGVRVESVNREVKKWDQPIAQQKHAGIVGFITKEIDGVLHFLVQLKLESGVMDLLEISPTVQCITDNYSLDDMPHYVKEILDLKNVTTIFDTCQSEEGGRFYKESNRSILLLGDDGFSCQESSKYLYMSLKQLKHFIKFSNFLNIEARSILACMEWR